MALRPVRVTGATFSARASSTTVPGVTRAAWDEEAVRMLGRSSGERGNTTIDKTFHAVKGWIETDSEGEAENLCINTAGTLVLNWVAAGGTAKTTTFGGVGGSNIVFTGAGPTRIGDGSEAGPTTRTRVNFELQFDNTDTTPTLAELIVTT